MKDANERNGLGPEKLLFIGPDEDHVAWCSSKGNDEGRDDRESQEVRKHPVAVIGVVALTRAGRKVAGNADAATVREHLRRHTRSHTHSITFFFF